MRFSETVRWSRHSYRRSVAQGMVGGRCGVLSIQSVCSTFPSSPRALVPQRLSCLRILLRTTVRSHRGDPDDLVRSDSALEDKTVTTEVYIERDSSLLAI